MQQIRSALSLFNGISGLHLALDKAQISVEQVYYSEIDKFANKVTEQRYPNDIALGDVTKWKEWDIDWSSVDLVSAGFPCQSWSVAGKQLGDKDERGMLFWTTLDIIKTVLEHNPKAKFLMENVKMKKDFEEYITQHTTEALGYVEKTLINSALVSAQNRNRYYWTNFKVEQPNDKGILLKDILEDGIAIKQRPRGKNNGGVNYSKSPTLTSSSFEHNHTVIFRPCERIKIGEAGHIANAIDINGMECIKRVYGQDGKSPTLTTMGGGHREPKVLCNDVSYRKLTPLECERLQTVPDNWTECLSNTQRYKSLGNGWTIDVIVHILECAFK